MTCACDVSILGRMCIKSGLTGNCKAAHTQFLSQKRINPFNMFCDQHVYEVRIKPNYNYMQNAYSKSYGFIVLPTQVVEGRLLDLTTAGRTTHEQPEPSSSSPSPITELEAIETSCHDHGILVSYLSSHKRARATAGTILQRCLSQVDQFRKQMNKSLCVFKLGITSNPAVRFQFYKEANYTHMTLLHVSQNAGAIQMLEAALIAFHLSQPGCRNERFGGEGPSTALREPFHFMYIVGARADCMKPIG